MSLGRVVLRDIAGTDHRANANLHHESDDNKHQTFSLSLKEPAPPPRVWHVDIPRGKLDKNQKYGGASDADLERKYAKPTDT